MNINTQLMLARKYLHEGDDGKAATMLRDIIKRDSTITEAIDLLSEIYYEHKKMDALSELYAKAARIHKKTKPDYIYLYANTLYELGEMSTAIVQYNEYLKSGPTNSNLEESALKMKKKAENSVELTKKPVPFNPVNMGKNVNSEHDEYLPSFSVDEKVLFITRKLPMGNSVYLEKDDFNEDFFYCVRQTEGNLSMAQSLSNSVNTPDNEGGHCVSSDGKTLVFTACNRYDGSGNCDLYSSRYINGKWTIPENMGTTINSSAWDSQPSLSSDGKTLYFSSTRKGSLGGADLWFSQQSTTGKWSTPVNLGNVLNTDESEISPYLHPDGKTLYFASKGHPGIGGYDLFVSRKNENNVWEKPINLGYPINTFKSEMSLMVSARGDVAYFASERPNGLGKQDIYSFELYAAVRPQMVTYFKGKVFDEVTGKILKATVEMIDLKTGKILFQSKTSDDGTFLVCFTAGNQHALNVSHTGYVFYSDNFTIPQGEYLTPVEKDIPLKPIKVGASFSLRNIFFDTDSYQLKESSFFELNKLLQFLKLNPLVTISIVGHTDNQGGNEYNMNLSQKRAQVVVDYLVSKGILVNRLTSKGMGLIKPLADNNTEAGRALNRRTEIVITGIK